MRILSYSDVHERQRVLTSNESTKSKYNVNTLYENLKTKYSFQNAKIILENWRELSNQEIDSFDKALEVFNMICDNDNITNITTASNIVEGKIVHKVRDGKATRHLNNYKLGKLKIQNTKVLNHTKDNENAVKTAIANKGNLGNSLHPNRKYKYDIYGKRVGENKKSEKEEKETQEKIEECYNRFIEESCINDQCDRVLTNYNKLTRRFDLDTKVRKVQLDSESISNCIYEMCEMIDGYDVSIGIKYNIALEEVMYLMNKNCIKIPNSTIVESVTDYFLLSRDCTDESIHDMKYIIENNHFYNEDELSSIEYLYKEPINESNILCTEDAIDSILESKEKKKSNIKDLIHEFKTSKSKSASTLRKCITRIFVNSPENIINEIPDIFQFLRITGGIALFGLNPIIGIIGLITSSFLKMKIKRNEMNRVVNEYKKHRDKYKEKLKKVESEKGKDKYKAMIKKLDEDILKLEEYEDNLYSEKENEKRTEEKYAKEYENDDSDDFNFNFDEMAMIDSISNFAMLMESMDWKQKELMNSIRCNIRDMTSSNIYDITESVILCNNIFDMVEFSNILSEDLQYNRSKSGLDKYEKIDTIHECLDKINKVKYDEPDIVEESDLNSIYNVSMYYKEITDDTLELINMRNLSFNEGSGLSISSKLKLAKENLKKFSVKLKDKDKTISDKLDADIGHVQQSAERALTNNNREAIIKGQLLPSASKCIKAAIATGAAWLVNPALAVIGVVGSIAMSKKLQKKERQLILDDIEVELKMCDKYLSLAENKNDMKAIRNIMQTKRSLERQQQRIKYNMAVEFNEKIPKAPKSSGGDSYDEQYVMLPNVEVI